MDEGKKSKFKTHLFICTKCTSFDDKGREDKEAATDLRKRLKKKLNSIYPEGYLRVNECGCLGRCETGINGVFYPQNKWLSGIKKNDDDLILKEVEHILKDMGEK